MDIYLYIQQQTCSGDSLHPELLPKKFLRILMNFGNFKNAKNAPILKNICIRCINQDTIHSHNNIYLSTVPKRSMVGNTNNRTNYIWITLPDILLNILHNILLNILLNMLLNILLETIVFSTLLMYTFYIL